MIITGLMFNFFMLSKISEPTITIIEIQLVLARLMLSLPFHMASRQIETQVDKIKPIMTGFNCLKTLFTI